MIEAERVRVGRALDVLRDALGPFVDPAMSAVYGAKWEDRVADEDAKRRPNQSRHPVSKNDLVVILKVIQYQRIAPWSDSRTRTDPRIRSFAAEIMNLRNLWAHGDECIGEYIRLLDTAGRLLKLLDLPEPSELKPPSQTRPEDLGGRDVEAPGRPPVAIGLFEAEFARLGEPGRRLMQIWARAEELSSLVMRPLQNDETEKSWATRTMESVGPEIVELFAETRRLEVGDGRSNESTLKAVALVVRQILLAQPLGELTRAYEMVREGQAIDRALSLLNHSDSQAAGVEAMALLQEEAGKEGGPGQFAQLLEGRLDGWHEVVRLSRQLNDGEALPNLLIVLANDSLLNGRHGSASETDYRDEDLRFVRDSVAHARALAAMDPGTNFETLLVVLLRREGQLCIDLGRSNEAMQAFTRADEIIDRYPTADPNLLR